MYRGTQVRVCGVEYYPLELASGAGEQGSPVWCYRRRVGSHRSATAGVPGLLLVERVRRPGPKGRVTCQDLHAPN